jgi:hypothetical protein
MKVHYDDEHKILKCAVKMGDGQKGDGSNKEACVQETISAKSPLNHVSAISEAASHDHSYPHGEVEKSQKVLVSSDINPTAISKANELPKYPSGPSKEPAKKVSLDVLKKILKKASDDYTKWNSAQTLEKKKSSTKDKGVQPIAQESKEKDVAEVPPQKIAARILTLKVTPKSPTCKMAPTAPILKINPTVPIRKMTPTTPILKVPQKATSVKVSSNNPTVESSLKNSQNNTESSKINTSPVPLAEKSVAILQEKPISTKASTATSTAPKVLIFVTSKDHALKIVPNTSQTAPDKRVVAVANEKRIVPQVKENSKQASKVAPETNKASPITSKSSKSCTKSSEDDSEIDESEPVLCMSCLSESRKYHHLITVLKKRPYICNHSGCNALSLSAKGLRLHKYSAHADYRETCEICGVEVKDLDRRCIECLLVFPSVKALIRHKNYVHERKFQCDICNKRYKFQGILFAHKRQAHSM